MSPSDKNSVKSVSGDRNLPPASRTKYFFPTSKPPRPFPSSNLERGSLLQYMDAASGSSASLSFVLGIPAFN